MRLLNIATVVTALAIAVAAPAIAAKGGNGNGGDGSGSGDAGPAAKAYSPTLSVDWPLSATSSTSAESPYVINGCGYDTSYGMVTVVVYSPVSAGWTGRMPEGGCISVSNFGTQGAGTYRIDAWQHVKNRDVVVATTSFTQ